MLYGVTVATRVLHTVQLEAETYNQAAEKARELVKTGGIETKIGEAARDIVGVENLEDIDGQVTAVFAFPETPAYA